MNYALLMSGGVDSALACHFMVEAGLRPDLFYIKIGMQGEDTTCTAEEDLELCQLTARRYALQLHTVDLQQAYHDSVTAYLVDRVRRGLTPNPDVMCNRLIKFGAFHQAAGHAYDRIATGHYAQVLREPDGQLWLAPSPDPVKDQSDFLSQTYDWQVRKMLFPIGHLHKAEVRRQADLLQLPAAHRRDSQGLCFLGRIHYTDYLRTLLGEQRGNIIHADTGEWLGYHRGHWFYTIGQRKGLRLGGGPWFVTHKDVATNTLYVSRTADAHGVYRQQFRLTAFHFVTTDPWHGAAECPVLCKIRHTEPPCPCHMQRLPSGDLLITSTTPLQGVAPGQFGVLYTADHRICAGSGEIRV
ncbi:MAG: tRNA 2-thiouridine(34) synthase MnmA [Bacteroidales bacterium]|nr:tRNA 2-thiouridine(34) synthase MnmA [Bacteroidales bacterium]